VLAVLVGALPLGSCGLGAQAGAPSRPATHDPRPAYTALVTSEVTDEIAVIRFTADSGWIERRDVVGFNPNEPDGPHGLGIAPAGDAYFVSTAHGAPFGHLWKLDAATGRRLAQVELGLFPASLQVSPDGHYVYVANFNLHGEMVPSSVSVVTSAELLEVARIDTCTMPHGSRFNAAGTRHYSTCMMDEVLVEIDATTFEVSRHFVLTRGMEHGGDGAPRRTEGGEQRTEHSDHGSTNAPAGSTKCSPTWAAPWGGSVYVACNASNEVVEIDVASWTVKRRIPARNGVYNLAVTRDGRRLVATNKRDQSVSVFDLATGRETAHVATQRRVVHGVAISPDDRYAFVSVEGYGSEPGTVEMIDLAQGKRVASVDVGQMAGGIDVMRDE